MASTHSSFKISRILDFFWIVLPNDENIMARGPNMPSKYDLCGTNSNVSNYFFLDFEFARSLLHGFDSILQRQVTYDIDSILNLCRFQ